MTESISRGELVQIDIRVDLSSWEGLFNTLEIWRSRLTASGPYEPLMGDSWKQARIPASIVGDAPSVPETGPSVNIVGRTLNLLINETKAIAVTFTGSNPLNLGQVATQIQGASEGLLHSFVLSSKLVVETTQAGSVAVLRVVGGDAAPLLGLPTVEPDSVAFGLDARLSLSAGKASYHFSDPNGRPEYFYRSRFFNTIDQTVSDWGTPFSGRFITGVSASNLVTGFIDFVDSQGVARANQEVLVYTRMDGTIIEGKVVVPTAPKRLLSDTDGHVEVQLVRGTNVTVAVAGTDLVRDIVVPIDPTVASFNLLDPTIGKDDLFKVRVPDLQFAARRSL